MEETGSESIRFRFSHERFLLIVVLAKLSIRGAVNLQSYKSSPHVSCRTNYFHFHYIKTMNKKCFCRHEEYVRPSRCTRLSGRLDRHHMGEALASAQITRRSSAPLSDLGCSSDQGFNHTEGKVKAPWCPAGVPPLTLIPFSKHISAGVVGFLYSSRFLCATWTSHRRERLCQDKVSWLAALFMPELCS